MKFPTPKELWESVKQQALLLTKGVPLTPSETYPLRLLQLYKELNKNNRELWESLDRSIQVLESKRNVVDWDRLPEYQGGLS